jgi:hypothetical protein
MFLPKPVPHHPFYYRRVHHGFSRRASLLKGFKIGVGCVLFLLIFSSYIYFFLLESP